MQGRGGAHRPAAHEMEPAASQPLLRLCEPPTLELPTPLHTWETKRGPLDTASRLTRHTTPALHNFSPAAVF